MKHQFYKNGKGFLLSLAIAMIVFSGTIRSSKAAKDENSSSKIEELLNYYNKQIYFTQNEGQYNEKVRFRADFPLGQAIVTDEGMIVSAYDPASVAARVRDGIDLESELQNGGAFRQSSGNLKGHTWNMNFLNRSSLMTISGKEMHSDDANYFIGRKSFTGIKSYGEIWYNNVYPNVDARYYPSPDGTLEYDIICKPGFDKSTIAIRFEGIDLITVSENGHLILHTSIGQLEFPQPVVYQKINGVQKSISAKYVVTDKNILHFEIGDFDASQPLVIDPIALRWATWVNTASTGDNHGHCIWVDPSDGAIYMVARVQGTTDQITPGAFQQNSAGNLEMIIGKYLEPTNIGDSGSRIWQTYIGGDGDDNPYAMEQGPDGNLYITGYTSSSNFPLLGGSAFTGSSIDDGGQSTDNIFIMKINKNGNSIKSSVIGGNGDDGSFDLRINSLGDIVICGNTESTNLSTLHPGIGASNTNHGGVDYIVFSINQDLSTLNWIVNNGGSGTDQATIMVLNKDNNDLFIGGYTTSNNFPTLNPRQSTIGGSTCGYLQKMNGEGSLTWSSYFQSANTKSTSILCMEFNTTKSELYFGGTTSGLASANISASGVYDNTYNNGTNDFFVCRMDTAQSFISSTYIGGSSNEVNMMGLNTDQNNDVFVFGYTNSTNFPVTSNPNTPLQSSNQGNNDKVFFKLSSSLASLMFSTYYGGSGDDYDPVGERGIKFSNCRIYTIVTSKSNNIPLTDGALNTSRSSSGVYEPGLVVWANPPDLLGNSIIGNQAICAGTTPNDITGSVPAYVLPTISRNGTTSSYPALGSAATYQWQISTDSTIWTNIPGATSQNLSGSTIGPLFQKTFFRRIIGGDACILAGAADQVVTVRIMSAGASVTNVSCFGMNDGSITATADGVAPFTFSWSTGETSATISDLSPGPYTVTVTDNVGCSASNTFNITQPQLVVADAGPDKSFTCITSSLTLNGSSNIQNATLSWTTPDGHIVSSTASSATVDAVGTYVLTATDPSSNCIGRDTAYVTIATANTSSSASVAICDNQSYTPPGGTAQTSAGTYVTHIPNAAGCDSTITTFLSVNPTYNTDESHSICQGGSYQLPWGGAASTAGDYSHTYSSLAGCDSIATIHISVNQVYNTDESHSICQGGSYQLPWGGAASTAGDYSHTYSSLAGCDSVATIHISINQVYNTSESHSICQGGSYQLPWGGAASTAGDYSHTYSSLAGCDSIATIHISLNQPYSSSESHSICQGSSYTLPWGGNVSTAGDYSHTYSTIAGCDSIVTIHLSVTQMQTCNITGNTNLCQGSTTTLCAPAGAQSYLWSNGATTQCITVHCAGTFSVTVTYAGGCTSNCSVCVHEKAVPCCSISGTTTICQGHTTTLSAPSGSYTYLWNTGATTRSITVSTGGTYSVTVFNAYGCSSTCNTTVTVVPSPSCNITGNTTICQGQSTTLSAPSGSGYSYHWSTGATTRTICVNRAGTYSVTVSTSRCGGCSSTCSVTVTALPRPSVCITGNTTISQGHCTTLTASSGYSGYHWNTGATSRIITVCNAGTYSVTVSNANGCTASASVCVKSNCHIHCRMIVNPSNGSAVAEVDGGVPPYSFVWDGDPENNSPLASVKESGTVTVTVIDANGEKTSASHMVILNKLDATAYPNPLTSETNIDFMNSGETHNTTVEVLDLNGKRISLLFDEPAETNKSYRVKWDAADIEPGFYMYRITCADKVIIGKLILEK
ncbi:MAG: T9SS type A sorting domain-containing protein [Bacteroidia bacterium]